MFYNNTQLYFHLRKLRSALTSVVLIAAVVMSSCGSSLKESSLWRPEYKDGKTDLYTLALRFAPNLYFHPDEPFEIITVIPVFHPLKPMIAYHIFLEDEVIFSGRGKSSDHEIIWVQYDQITLKITDVFTLWHRTVLRTDACLMDAKASGQRPKVDVQWGQHGMLPFGWQTMLTVRPRSELKVHYGLVRHFTRIPGVSARGAAVSFKGSYDEYLQFTRLIDTSTFIKEQDVIVAEYSAKDLESRIKRTFSVKKEWPDW